MASSRLRACVLVVSVLLSVPAWAGQFVPVYSEVSDPQFREWQADLQAEQVLEALAADLNASLSIPTDVVITFGECGTANAFYNPEQQAIVMCFELVREFEQGAAEAGMSEEDAEQAVVDATMFFFYHELGHALIHVLDLPTTGKEEDAVDQLSIYVLAYDAEEGQYPALTAATAFAAWAEEEQQAGGASAFWDEHSLNEQRFYNIVCWVYGQQPDQFQSLVEQGFLPEDRAARCPGEWQQIDKSWSMLLADHLKGE